MNGEAIVLLQDLSTDPNLSPGLRRTLSFRPGPQLAGIHATSDKALAHPAVPLCTCPTPSLCCGRDGRSPSGAHCRGHLAPQLEEDGNGQA